MNTVVGIVGRVTDCVQPVSLLLTYLFGPEGPGFGTFGWVSVSSDGTPESPGGESDPSVGVLSLGLSDSCLVQESRSKKRS